MAVCPNCGKENATNAIFCEACGTLMSGSYNKDVPLEPEVITKVRRIGGSGLMLAIAIIQSIVVAFSIPSLEGFGINFPITSIFSCIAFWLIYYTCKKPQGYLISTSGVTILRVFSMLGIIGFSILLFAVAVLSVALPSLASYYENTVNTSEYGASFVLYLGGIVAGCAAVGVLLGLLKMIFSFRFYGSVSETVKSGFPVCKSAAPLAVFLMIGGIFSALGSVAALIFNGVINEYLQTFLTQMQTFLTQYGAETNVQYSFSGLSIYLESLITLLTAALSIMGAVIILRYRSQVKE